MNMRLLVFLISISFSSASQSPFIKYIGGGGSDFGTAITRLPDDTYALTLELNLNFPQNDSSSATLVKTNCIGEVEWYRNYIIDQVNYGTDVIVTSDNAMVMQIAGLTPFTQFRSEALLKTDMNGTLLWCKKFEMEGTLENKLSHDGEGNIYILANTKYVQGNYDGIGVLKFSANGNLIWAKEYSFTYGCMPVSLAILPDGNCAVAGKITIPGNSFNDVLLMVLDSSGFQVKTVVAGTFYDDEAMGLDVDASGNIHVCGRTYFLNRNWDGMHLVFNLDLDVIASEFYDGSTAEGEIFRKVICDGNSTAFFGDEGTFDARNLLIVKSTSGLTDWSKHYSVATIYTNYLFGACSNGRGGYVATGDSHQGVRYRDAIMLQVDSLGNSGCVTSDFLLTVYNEITTVIDTLLTESILPVTVSDFTPALASDPVTTLVRCSPLDMCIVFDHEQDSICPQPCIQLTDLSLGNTAVLWEVNMDGNIETSALPEPVFCFPHEGEFEVTLTISNGGGTLKESRTIFVEKDCPVFVPNIFTPNNDQKNDVFKIRELPDQFNLQVFNRWGGLIFKTSDPSDYWNGENENGTLVSSGTYYYILELMAENKVMKGWVEVVY